MRITTFALVFLSATASAATPVRETLDHWISNQTGVSTRSMLANIGPSTDNPSADPGAVIASPSLDPDYRYHWVRDGALTLDTVLGLYRRSHDSAERSGLLNTLFDYVDFSRRNQLMPNLSGGADDLGLGEPKFKLDGNAYDEPWGHPQNDGPALRASTLSRLAMTLLDQGQASWVRQKLYDPALPARTVIKSDLEFVSHHWQDSSFDLWEEVRGGHFYTRMVQRRALIEGAALAERLGDLGAASWYRSQAVALESAITHHWDATKNMITATLDRAAGLGYKTSGLDVAVVLGVLHGASRANEPGDPFFGLTDDRVLATVAKIEESFRRIYGVNSRDQDPSDGQPLGTAIGRYPEDRYSGGTAALGNPWFLATAAFAEFYYDSARTLKARGSLVVTKLNASFFRKLKIASRVGGLRVGERLVARSDPRFQAVVQGMMDAGDAFLRRVKLHADASGALSEQFNRDTGVMQSAIELTWSHASLVTAVWARELARESR